MTRMSRRLLPGGETKGLFTFLLLACFAVLALMIVLVGARVYGRIADQSEQNFTERTALSYVAGKVRAASGGDVSVMETDGASVLVLAGTYGGARYHTYIYYRDGAIREYFAAADRAFAPEYGDRVAKTAGFSATVADGLLTLSVPDDAGELHTLALALRPGGGDGA